MAYLSKAQIKDIVKKAPAGTSPEGVISALRAQGHELEGYPSPQQVQKMETNVQQTEQKKNVLTKAADFLGIEKFGRGIGTAINNLTGGLKPIEEAQSRLMAESDRLLADYKKKRAAGDKKGADAAMKALQETNQSLQDLATSYADIGTGGGLTNKEVLGSAAMTFGNIALAGAGAQGQAVRGSVGGSVRAPQLLKAGEAVTSAIPAITKPIVRNAGAQAYLKSLGVNMARSGAVGAAFGAAGAAEQNEESLLRGSAIGLLVGGALPVAGEAIRGIAKGVGATSKLLAQTFARTPAKALEYAKANPEGVRAGIRRAISDENTVFKVANTANKAAANIEAKRNAAFSKGLAKLEGQMKGQVIDPTPFNERLKQSLMRFDVITSKGKINPESIISDPRELKDIQTVLGRMKSTSNLTPEGWWKLKRFVDNKYRPTASNEFNALIADMSDGLRDEMVKNVKGFDKLLSGYEADSTLLNFLKKELGVTGRARGVQIGEGGEVLAQDNTKRVINALRRAMSDNQPLANELVQELQRVGGKSVMDDLAGMYFASWLPQAGLQTFLGLGAGGIATAVAGVGTAAKAAPLLAFGSPRIVGEGAALAGQITRGLRSVPPQLTEMLKNAGRAGIFNAQQ